MVKRSWSGAAPTVLLRIGLETIPVETRALRVSATDSRTVALRKPRAECLEVGPSSHARLFFVLLALFGVGMGTCLYLGGPEGPLYRYAGVGIGVVFVAAGVLMELLFRRVRFDRAQGTFSVGSGPLRKTYPLQHVLAVQVVHDTEHVCSDGSWEVYQLNLVVEDPDRRRLHVSSHGDGEWTRQTGKRLAEFLQVPLLELAPAAG
jgi:hypothetical protein